MREQPIFPKSQTKENIPDAQDQKKKETKPKSKTISKPKAAKFVIYFKATATGDALAAIESALRGLRGASIAQDGRNNCFRAKLKWGTEIRDRNNLMGRLNEAANGGVLRVDKG